jgi:hypothetical protein
VIISNSDPHTTVDIHFRSETEYDWITSTFTSDADALFGFIESEALDLYLGCNFSGTFNSLEVITGQEVDREDIMRNTF